MIKEDINIATFMQIAKAGILLGQANPTINPDKLVDELVVKLLQKARNNDTREP